MIQTTIRFQLIHTSLGRLHLHTSCDQYHQKYRSLPRSIFRHCERRQYVTAYKIQQIAILESYHHPFERRLRSTSHPTKN